MKNFQNFGKQSKKIQDLFKKSSFFKHFYDLTGPKYSKFYEDSESGIKSIHFLAKMMKKHEKILKMIFEVIFLNKIIIKSLKKIKNDT